MKQFVCSWLSLIVIFSLNAQSFDTAKMDTYFELIETYDKSMGNISIFKHGEEVYNRSIGLSNVEKNVRADHDTKYRIGSISKSITAVICIQLIEEGKLSYDDLLAKFFPDLPNADSINIEHLLRHRSGLYNVTNDEDYLSWNTNEHSREDMMARIQKGGTIFSPGETADYANTNFVLLSYIIEDIEKTTYAEVLNARIVKALGLKNCYYGSEIINERNEARSYNFLTNWIRTTETAMSIPLGAGAIVASSHDVNVFYHALFSGKLISDSNIEKMTTIMDGYGMGIFQFPFYDRNAFGHTGGIDGFTSMSGHFPEENVTVTYCSNGSIINNNDIMIAVLSIYFGRDYELPDFSKVVKVAPEILQTYVGLYKSDNFPMDIQVTLLEQQLMAQATGQSAFPLEAVDEKTFKFEAAGVEISFNSELKAMRLNQGGLEVDFKKED